MKTTIAILLLTLLFSADRISCAEESSPFSGSATFTTDYIFRGLSQTDENPAVQADFGYAHPLGFYLGAWGSSVDESISDGNVEIDLYGGYSRELFKNFTVDAGVIYYWYPGDNDDPEVDFVEGHVGAAYAFSELPLSPELGAGFNYSPDFYGEDGDAYYVNGTLGLTLPYKFGLGFEVGYQDVEGGETTGNGAGLNGGNGFDYVFWKVGLSREVLGFALDVSYYDTNEQDYLGDIGGEHVVFSISRSF